MIDRSGRGRNSAEARVTALVALAVFLALPLLGATPATPPAPAPPPQGLSLPQAAQPQPTLAGGPAPDLDLLYTAQVAGWIEPCG